MLVAGFAALVATLAVRVSHRAAAPAASAFSAAPVALPRGARIEAVGGGGERIIVALILADGSRELLVIDAASFRRLGVIPLSEEK
jgi:hypothetical protein